jgi:hypothetical protein
MTDVDARENGRFANGSAQRKHRNTRAALASLGISTAHAPVMRTIDRQQLANATGANGPRFLARTAWVAITEGPNHFQQLGIGRKVGEVWIRGKMGTGKDAIISAWTRDRFW